MRDHAAKCAYYLLILLLSSLPSSASFLLAASSSDRFSSSCSYTFTRLSLTSRRARFCLLRYCKEARGGRVKSHEIYRRIKIYRAQAQNALVRIRSDLDFLTSLAPFVFDNGSGTSELDKILSECRHHVQSCRRRVATQATSEGQKRRTICERMDA